MCLCRAHSSYGSPLKFAHSRCWCKVPSIAPRACLVGILPPGRGVQAGQGHVHSMCLPSIVLGFIVGELQGMRCTSLLLHRMADTGTACHAYHTRHANPTRRVATVLSSLPLIRVRLGEVAKNPATSAVLSCSAPFDGPQGRPVFAQNLSYC